jgi:hypothetical protein
MSAGEAATKAARRAITAVMVGILISSKIGCLLVGE